MKKITIASPPCQSAPNIVQIICFRFFSSKNLGTWIKITEDYSKNVYINILLLFKCTFAFDYVVRIQITFFKLLINKGSF